MTSFMRMSQKLVFHQSKCISAIKRILSTTAMCVSSSSFMYLRFPCYCDACLNSRDLRVGVKTLLNTIQYSYSEMHGDHWEYTSAMKSLLTPKNECPLFYVTPWTGRVCPTTSCQNAEKRFVIFSCLFKTGVGNLRPAWTFGMARIIIFVSQFKSTTPRQNETPW